MCFVRQHRPPDYASRVVWGAQEPAAQLRLGRPITHIHPKANNIRLFVVVVHPPPPPPPPALRPPVMRARRRLQDEGRYNISKHMFLDVRNVSKAHIFVLDVQSPSPSPPPREQEPGEYQFHAKGIYPLRKLTSPSEMRPPPQRRRRRAELHPENDPGQEHLDYGKYQGLQMRTHVLHNTNTHTQRFVLTRMACAGFLEHQSWVGRDTAPTVFVPRA